MTYSNRIMPFYMSYPFPMHYAAEDTVKRDLDYLQQMYPKEAKRYQKRINDILDKLDYDGSMIYDEYPDKWQLYHLSENIIDILRRDTREDPQESISDEKWEWLSDLIQILLYYEIYKRRINGRGKPRIMF